MYWAECVMGIISLVPYDNPMRFKHSYFPHCRGEKAGWEHVSDLIKVPTLHLIVHTMGVLPIQHHPLVRLHFWTALMVHSGKIRGMIPTRGKHWGHVRMCPSIWALSGAVGRML